MKREEFELLLDKVVARLGDDVRRNNKYHKPNDFQNRVLEVLREVAKAEGALDVNPSFHPHAFPDIRANGFGIEAKK